jgi:hypothetical protein
MAYEVYIRFSDEKSERILKLLLDARVAFAEIQLGEKEAAAMERLEGRSLPLVKQKGRVIGGYSDLVNSLRRRKRPAVRPVLGC